MLLSTRFVSLFWIALICIAVGVGVLFGYTKYLMFYFVVPILIVMLVIHLFLCVLNKTTVVTSGIIAIVLGSLSTWFAVEQILASVEPDAHLLSIYLGVQFAIVVILSFLLMLAIISTVSVIRRRSLKTK